MVSKNDFFWILAHFFEFFNKFWRRKKVFSKIFGGKSSKIQTFWRQKFKKIQKLSQFSLCANFWLFCPLWIATTSSFKIFIAFQSIVPKWVDYWNTSRCLRVANSNLSAKLPDLQRLRSLGSKMVDLCAKIFELALNQNGKVLIDFFQGWIFWHEFQGRSPYAMGGHSANFRSLGPPGAEIWLFLWWWEVKGHISAPVGPRDLKFSLWPPMA